MKQKELTKTFMMISNLRVKRITNRSCMPAKNKNISITYEYILFKATETNKIHILMSKFPRENSTSTHFTYYIGNEMNDPGVLRTHLSGDVSGGGRNRSSGLSHCFIPEKGKQMFFSTKKITVYIPFHILILLYRIICESGYSF